MYKPYMGVCLMVSWIVAGQATAQAPSSPPLSAGEGTSPTGSATKGPVFLEYRQPDQFRSTNLRGTRVYGANNENIGEINDVLINRNGQVVAVMIGVGGFLGIGEKDVAIPMSMLLFQPGAVAADSQDTSLMGKTVSPSPPVTNAQPGAATGTSPPATSAAARHDNGIPDRLILTMTKEQLQSAPAFQDNVSDSSSNIESSGTTAPAPPATQRP